MEKKGWGRGGGRGRQHQGHGRNADNIYRHRRSSSQKGKPGHQCLTWAPNQNVKIDCLLWGHPDYGVGPENLPNTGVGPGHLPNHGFGQGHLPNTEQDDNLILSVVIQKWKPVGTQDHSLVNSFPPGVNAIT